MSWRHKNMKEMILWIRVSNKPDKKKYMAKIQNDATKRERIIHFGGIKTSGDPYEQFKDRTKLQAYKSYNHGDKERQHNYYLRHSGTKSRDAAIELEKKRGNFLYTPRLLSHIYLW